MGSTAELCLRWSSYETTLLSGISDLWDGGAMTDVTLSADGRTIKAHQAVLSSCSGYFREVLKNVAQGQHPIIVLPFTGHDDLLAVVEFMYRGEVNITQLELPGLLSCAESLQVKGLAKINPLKASGLLREAFSSSHQPRKNLVNCSTIKTEPLAHDYWNNGGGSVSYGEDEEAVEFTEITDDDETLGSSMANKDNAVIYHDSDCADAPSNDAYLSEGEHGEGQTYFFASVNEQAELEMGKGEDNTLAIKQRSRRRLYRTLNAAWNTNGRNLVKKEPKDNGSNGRSAIRKTLLPVSCPVCFKVLSNAYNLKVHMSIHDGLNHQCSVCGHTSKSRDALRKHLAYRHLIGMSGPVRPRMPTNKRKKAGEEEANNTQSEIGETEDDDPIAPSNSYSDPDDAISTDSTNKPQPGDSW